MGARWTVGCWVPSKSVDRSAGYQARDAFVLSRTDGVEFTGTTMAGCSNMPGTAQAGRAATSRGARSADLDRSIITVNETCRRSIDLKAPSAPTGAAATLVQLER